MELSSEDAFLGEQLFSSFPLFFCLPDLCSYYDELILYLINKFLTVFISRVISITRFGYGLLLPFYHLKIFMLFTILEHYLSVGLLFWLLYLILKFNFLSGLVRFIYEHSDYFCLGLDFLFDVY